MLLIANRLLMIYHAVEVKFASREKFLKATTVSRMAAAPRASMSDFPWNVAARARRCVGVGAAAAARGRSHRVSRAGGLEGRVFCTRGKIASLWTYLLVERVLAWISTPLPLKTNKLADCRHGLCERSILFILPFTPI